MRIDDYQNLWSRPAAELRKVNASDSDVATYALNERDLLINRVNSLTHLGKVLRVGSQHIPAVFESNMMRMSVADCLCVDYVAFYLKSEQGRHGLTKNAKHAVNQASINQQDVLGALVPLPSIDEQTEIVAQAEATLSNIAQAEAEITRSLERAARLRQAILKRAFEGRLV
jgi:type I restriction enzyme S subunit